MITPCSPYRSPWQNPYIERFIGTLRRGLLDHVIVRSRSHLDRLLKEFIEGYYHLERPHRGSAARRRSYAGGRAMAEPTRLISIPCSEDCITVTAALRRNASK